jgi:hypothetical protein
MLLYFLIYMVIKLFLGQSFTSIITSRLIDFFAIILLMFVIFYLFFSSSSVYTWNNRMVNGSNDPIGQMLIYIRNFFDTPVNILFLVLVICIVYLLLFLFGVPMNEYKPVSVQILMYILWGLFIYDVFEIVIRYLFLFSITDYLLNPLINGWYSLPSNLHTPVPIYEDDGDSDEICDQSGNVIGNTTSSNAQEEVFNIGNNLYTYDDAQSVCQSYGARLATYDEIEDSYNNGGEWCNYGWSDKKLALFPTQKDTWNKLQKTANHKNDCGRPGINGGYMANPYLKFGVNCYGVKPNATARDVSGDVLDTIDTDSIDYTDPANSWRQNGQVSINSFNHNKWSRY